MPAKSGVTYISWIGTWGNGSQWNTGLRRGWSSVLALVAWAVDLDLFCLDSLHGWHVLRRAIFTEETKSLALVICKNSYIICKQFKDADLCQFYANVYQFKSISRQFYETLIYVNFRPIFTDSNQFHVNFTNSYQLYVNFKKKIPILDKQWQLFWTAFWREISWYQSPGLLM